MTPKLGQLRFEEAAQDVINDYRTNGKRSLKVLQRRITKHLEPFFGGRRMASITTSDIRQYIAKRQSDSFVVRRARRSSYRPVASPTCRSSLGRSRRVRSTAR